MCKQEYFDGYNWKYIQTHHINTKSFPVFSEQFGLQQQLLLNTMEQNSTFILLLKIILQYF